MKLKLLLAISLAAFAQEPKPASETIESLQAQVVSLKADLAALRLEAQYQLQVCQSPDLMAARLAAKDAAARAEAAKPKVTIPSPGSNGAGDGDVKSMPNPTKK